MRARGNNPPANDDNGLNEAAGFNEGSSRNSKIFYNKYNDSVEMNSIKK